MAGAPRPRLGDHLRVAVLLVQTVAGAAWFLLWLLAFPVARPWMRSRARARLHEPPRPLHEPPPPDPGAWEGKTVFVVAGEVSGDLLAARAIRAIRARCPGVRVRGYGGPASASAGAALDHDIVGSAVFGVIPVLLSLPRWWRLCAETLARFREDPPDLLLTVDYPGLNVRLARWARLRGIPAAHLVAPAIWAYAPWRAFRWRRAVDGILATFPFEPALFEGLRIPTTFVGHPLFEAPLPPPRTPDAWPGGGACTVEILPGSRRREVEGTVPDLLEAAAIVARRLPEARFVVRLANEGSRPWYERAAAGARERPEALDVRVGVSRYDAPLLGALACSGTVTAELAADLVPLTAFYRINFATRLASWTIVTAPWYTLPNLVLGEGLVTERGFVRRGAAPRLAEDFLRVVGTAGAWESHRSRLAEARRRLAQPDVADRIARAALALGPRR